MKLAKQDTHSNCQSRALTKDRRGLSTVEYVIILALIAVAAIATWRAFGNAIISKVGNHQSEVEGL
jgi:Flp pilus assembly pilin Flp